MATADAEMSLIERSACAKTKYQVGELMKIPPYMKGTHPFNRPIMEGKVHGLCSTLLQDGWDIGEEDGCVIQEKPGTDFILAHNEAMVSGSLLLPAIDPKHRLLLQYGTIDHGHQNWALRVFFIMEASSADMQATRMTKAFVHYKWCGRKDLFSKMSFAQGLGLAYSAGKYLTRK